MARKEGDCMGNQVSSAQKHVGECEDWQYTEPDMTKLVVVQPNKQKKKGKLER